VNEWCLNKNDDPRNPAALSIDNSGALRMIRGGDWGTDPAILRSAFRFGANPDVRTIGLGFRLAQEIE
jgi:formylglycine-generating enzyme required for sulfatase activity